MSGSSHIRESPSSSGRRSEEASFARLADESAALLLRFPADDPVVVLFLQQRVALLGRIPGRAFDARRLSQRLAAMQNLMADAESYRLRLASGEGGPAQAAARAVCSEVGRLLHDKAARYAALRSEGDDLLATRVIVSADVARRVGTSPDGFQAIGPTAVLVNQLRCLDRSIPYGLSLAGGCSGNELMRRYLIGYREGIAMGALFQARYRAINRTLASFAPAQIIELASGLSPRGLHLTRDNPAMVYVETDLPDVLAEKMLAVNAIVRRERSRGGFLRFEAVDASNQNAVVRLLERLRDDQTTAIVTEGLLLYLDRAELDGFCETMRHTLAGSGRTWIADLVTRENLRQMFDASPRVAEAVKRVFRSTRREVVQENPLVDDASVVEFLARHGLRVAGTLRLAEIVAEHKVHCPVTAWHDDLIRLVGERKIWEIRAE